MGYWAYIDNLMFAYTVPVQRIFQKTLLPLNFVHCAFAVEYIWFKYDLDICTMHPKFDLDGVRTHDL